MIRFFSLFLLFSTISSFTSRGEPMSYCAYSWLCCELICSPTKKAITQEWKKKMLSVAPSYAALGAIMLFCLSYFSLWRTAGLSFFYFWGFHASFLKFRAARTEGSSVFHHWSESIPPWHVSENLHSSICKKTAFFWLLLHFHLMLEKQPVQLKNCRLGKQIWAAKKEQHHLIFSTMLFMHEWPP